MAVRLVQTVIALPAVVVGAAIHVVPYQVMKRLAQIPTNESIKATVELLGCFALFTLEYVVLSVIVALRAGALAGVAVLVAAPLSGWATVRAVERAKRVGGLVEGSRVLRNRPDLLATLQTQRQSISLLATAAAAEIDLVATNVVLPRYRAVLTTASRSRLRYGPRRAQVGDLWRPTSPASAVPVVVLIHGGYWRALYTKRLMSRLAFSVTAQGWAAWNIEYRRVGALGGCGGWPKTRADVALAIDHLAGVNGVDLDRVAVCGHSAGGQLALWAAGRRSLGDGAPRRPVAVPVCAAVSLAGLVDLAHAARSGLGNGAVQRFMGGGPDAVPNRYRAGSPAALLPLGIPQLLVHGLADMTVPASMSERYARCAGEAGDAATYLPFPRLNHLDMIDPKRSAWQAVINRLQPLLDR